MLKAFNDFMILYTYPPGSSQGPLLDLHYFHIHMIKWDGMHVVNLGVDLWVVGSVMRKLFAYEVFGGCDMEEADRYLVAYDMFKAWCRKSKVGYLEQIC